MADKPLFSLDQISLTIDQKAILHPLSLDISPGKVVGLIGHNGSGKSSLLSLLAGQQKATNGQIHFMGQSLSDYNSRDKARKIAFLPQKLPVIQGLTALDLIKMGRYPWHGSLRPFQAEDQQQVDKAAERTKVSHLLNQDMASLSGGEAQRVWLAMLLAQQADCLLLDEPISALDIAHQIEVLNLIQSLAHQDGISVILVLHDLGMAARFCDHLIALKQGKLVTSGTVTDVMTSEILTHLYDVNIQTSPHPIHGTPSYYVA